MAALVVLELLLTITVDRSAPCPGEPSSSPSLVGLLLHSVILAGAGIGKEAD